MATQPVEMQTYSARLSSFKSVPPPNKRRASSQAKKRKDGTAEWPHKSPTPEDLARAGFFYQPDQGSTDNVQCFLCNVKLDGWEATDDPVREHLAHSKECAWALAVNVERCKHESTGDSEDHDPMSETMAAARQRTFTVGAGWPHENKKGWKCKILKMVEAGWIWDPNPDTDELDGVTCFYCDLSLDGWEPKDDPRQEHQRRMPECKFFQLLEKYHDPADAGKTKKGKGRAKASARSSAVSKASRTSSQSVMSDITSIAMDSSLPGIDDSDISTGTTTSQATTTGPTNGKKKAGRPKAAAKGTKGRKKAGAGAKVDSSMADVETGQTQEGPESTSASEPVHVEDELVTVAAEQKPRSSRTVKQVDSSVIEASQTDAPPPKKTARGRKPKAKKQPEPEPEIDPIPLAIPQTPDAAAIAKARESAVSAQLQDELEHSMETALENVEDESTPQVMQPSRGVKRTSDGRRKKMEERSSIAEIEFPVPPKSKPEAKAKRGRKPKQTSAASSDVEMRDGNDGELAEQATDKVIPPPKKGKGRAKEGSSQSVQLTKDTRKTSQPSVLQLPADFGNDELEIEEELDRIAAEESQKHAIQAEQEQVEEYEASPSNPRQSKEIQALEHKAQPETAAPPPAPTPSRPGFADLTPSPSGSDKENQPSSLLQQSVKQTQPTAALSPSKPLTRIPLAPGTPNRSPTRALAQASPSKHISHLTSAKPWTAVDLETILLLSPQPTPGRLGQQLVDAAGALTSPEKTMSVEEWIRFRAERSEEELRRRCEEMVGTFEKQGMRALETLEGLGVGA